MKKKKKTNLLIVITTDNIDSIMKFPMLYGGVSIPRGYWKKVHISFWGPSIKVAKENLVLREKILEVQKDGVKFSSCIVCSEDYDAVESLNEINIPSVHTGEILNKALQNDHKWSTLTI